VRKELFYNPLLLLERIGEWAAEKRRLNRLSGTPGKDLNRYHIDSLELLELLKKNPPKVIYDIGANRGTWTLLAKSLYPESEIHAFEPLESLEKEFRKNTASLQNVHWHGAALGSRRENSFMTVNSSIDTSSLLPLAKEGKKEWNVSEAGKTSVEIWPLDTLREVAQLPWPNLIKLDVQGYELECLKGAIECLSQKPTILCEISFKQFYQNQPRFSDLVSFLGSLGFEIAGLGKGTTLGTELSQTDAWFLPTVRSS
jgi:FkbM family methyltransferase